MRFLSILLSIVLSLLAGAAKTPAQNMRTGANPVEFVPKPPDIPREFRGVWIATVANIDWPSAKGLPVETQKQELLDILDAVVNTHMNAVVFQVRPHCDALYDSKLEPWSEYLTGTMGKAPSPYYDPLAFAIEEAHKRGLELHAWFNPYRALHPAAKTMAPNHISKANPQLVRKYGEYLWLDPSDEGTKQHSLNVILDVVHRYDVDGVQIDDYFYPYKSYAEGEEFPDLGNYQQYKKKGGTLSRDDWRRQHVNDFVERFYKSVKAEKSWVKVGISPFGIWRPGHPPTVKGFDQYSELYADARHWLNNGWVDYWTPQLYWVIGHSTAPYKDLLTWWVSEDTKKRHVWPGNAIYKISEGDSPWPVTEIINQIKATRDAGATGNIHFSAKYIVKNTKDIDDALLRTVYKRKAIIPASPWLDAQPPAGVQPRFRTGKDGSQYEVSWDPVKDNVFGYGVYVLRNGEWDVAILPMDSTVYRVEKGQGTAQVRAIALSVFDRAWNESPRATLIPGMGQPQ